MCSKSDGSLITIYPNICQPGDECFINENSHGTCEKAIDRSSDLLLYPGYRCRGDEVVGTCAFGTKICNNNDRCEGIPPYGSCKRSSDCNFGFYCNEAGICLEANLEGDQCTTHASCEK